MKNQSSLWPQIIIGTVLGLIFFGVLFFLVIIGLTIYVSSSPDRSRDVLSAIDNGDWPDLSAALIGKTSNIINVQPKTRKNPSVVTHFDDFSFPSLAMNNINITKMLVPALLIGAIVLIVLDGIVNVPAGHVGVIFDRGRGVLETELDEGIHLKIPFWQSVIMMNTRLQTYTMSTQLTEADMINNTKALQLQSLVNSSESAVRDYAMRSGTTNNSIDALTKDGQRVTVDLTVQFQIDGNNASEIYRTIGLNYVDKVVRPAARSITREKVTGFTSKELYNEATRQQMEQDIEATLKQNFGSKNVILGDVLIRHIGFSQSYLSAIEEKQIAQQKIEKAEFEKQEAEIRKEKTIIEAEAEAESIRLKGEALSQSPEVIQLQFVEKMSPQIKWGVLPDTGLPLLDIEKLTQ